MDNSSSIRFEEILKLFTYQTQSSSTSSGATNTMLHSDNAMHSMITSGGSSVIRAIDDGISSDADIGNFLSRKVRIHNSTWAVGADFVQIINPWEAFFNNSAVGDKLANYYLIKADMEITILVNGTPFHAGMLLASYAYMGVTNALVTIGGDTQAVTRSQRPHCWLNISTNKSGCLCVPFFAPTPYFSLGDATQTAATIGVLNIDSLRSLVQINAGTDTVSVSVFAQLKNVKLTAPTQRNVTISGESKLTVDSFFKYETQAAQKSKQPKDEYKEDGVVSGPASAIADYAGYFTQIPYIGPFATATQMGATAIGGIARLFGYSKPAIVDDTKFMRNMVVGNLALTEGGDTSQKLTITSKQEISIDPATVGFDGTDELAIAYIAQTESYLTQFEWAVTDAQEDYIFAIDVDPMAERRTAVTGGYQFIPTALSFVSRAFAEWSGTLKFRFQVIASQYHRGRIGIIYDPYGGSGANPYNVTFNTILDLADARDVTLSIKWQNDRPYLECDGDDSRTFWTQTTPGSRTVTRDHANGVLYVQVINELVVPDATTSAHMLVSISAGDDFELVNPRGDNMQCFPYAIGTESSESLLDVSSFFTYETQASATEVVPVEENAPEGENVVEVTTDVLISKPQKSLIYYGERITSIRQLIKRYALWRTMGVSTSATNTQKYVWCMKQFPTTGGWDPVGSDATSPSATPYWFNASTPLTYFKYWYAGWRGSVRYKFCPNSNIQNISVQRYTGDLGRRATSNFRPQSTITISSAQSTSVSAQEGLLNADFSAAGAALTQNRTMDALEVEIPYHVPLRFSLTHNKFNVAGTNTIENGYPGGDAFWLIAHTEAADPLFNCGVYTAAGEDFTFFGRVGAPVLYRAPIPTPAP